MRRGDEIVLNRSRLIADAKQAAIELAEAGYTQPKKRTDIKVQGKAGIALFKAGIQGMKMGRYISEHECQDCGEISLRNFWRRFELSTIGFGTVLN